MTLIAEQPRLKTPSNRRLMLVVVGLVLLGLLAWVGISIVSASHEPTYSADGTVAVAPVGGSVVDALTRQFNGNRQATALALPKGLAAFFVVKWHASQPTQSGCHTQLAIATPIGWHLFGWASDQSLINGTINSWGSVQGANESLTAAKDTFILSREQTGTATLAWSVDSVGTTLAANFHAYFVYACGDASSSPTISEARVKFNG